MGKAAGLVWATVFTSLHVQHVQYGMEQWWTWCPVWWMVVMGGGGSYAQHGRWPWTGGPGNGMVLGQLLWWLGQCSTWLECSSWTGEVLNMDWSFALHGWNWLNMLLMDGWIFIWMEWTTSVWMDWTTSGGGCENAEVGGNG
uniref:Secreted protein n=1 Tax=Meloidogyne hapla TaxID=6305 RepID=A0A1I8BKE9_MELHA